MPSTNATDLTTAVNDLVAFAVTRHQAGDHAGAKALYGKALSLLPTQPVALHNLGLLHLGDGQLDPALTLLQEAVRVSPGEAAFRYSLAAALQQNGQLEAALDHYEAATRCRPTYREAWENRGVALQDLNRLDDAIDSYRQALRIDPLSPVACLNLPKALRAAGRIDEALAEYRRILAAKPLDQASKVGLGTTLIASGDYEAAWPFYEARLAVPEFLANTRPFRVPLPRWDGDFTGDEHLLVYGEQGIGDEIQFASCLPDLAAARPGQLSMLCDRRLVKLFARSFPDIAFAAQDDDQPEPEILDRLQADCCAAIGSLPQYFRRSASAFTGTPYLAADPAATARWQERLAALGPGPKIGISWRGGNEARTRRARSIPLAEFTPLLAAGEAVFVNIQYGRHDDEIAAVNAGERPLLHSFPEVDPLRDMDDFAALVGALDLVISIDNSTVHLAGALGVPTWLLLPAFADWRWTHGQETTPWYGSVRMIWQQSADAPHWHALIGEVSRQLCDWHGNAGSRHRCPPHPPKSLPAEAPTRPLALLVNDTAYWYHWGCTATSLALHEGLRDSGYRVDSLPITALKDLSPLPRSLDSFDDPTFAARFVQDNPAVCARLARSDRVVINGEGTLHGVGPAALALLTLAWVAKTVLGKNTRIINHSAYPADRDSSDPASCEAVYRKIYGVMDDVVVREPSSSRALSRLGLRHRVGFDCLPLFLLRHPIPPPAPGKRIVLAGSVELSPRRVDTLVLLAETCLAEGYGVDVLVGANAWPAADDEAFVTALHSRLRGRYRLVEARSERQWLATLADAALLISGRFHHTIAAAFQGTAVAVASSNTAKIEGLFESLGLAADQVWLDLESPADAEACVRRLLRDPETGCAAGARLDTLRARARENFSGLSA